MPRSRRRRRPNTAANPMFVQTVQTRAELPVQIPCLVRTQTPRSFVPPDTVQTPQAWTMSRWAIVDKYVGTYTTAKQSTFADNLPWGTDAQIRYNKFICYCQTPQDQINFYYGDKGDRRFHGAAWQPVDSYHVSRKYKVAFEIPEEYNRWFSNTDTSIMIDAKGAVDMEVWAAITIWTADTFSIPLAGQQSVPKFEQLCNYEYAME